LVRHPLNCGIRHGTTRGIRSYSIASLRRYCTGSIKGGIFPRKSSYQRSHGKGWGVIAKELGIKRGSPEFHALKRGAFTFTGEPSGASSDKGKGKGKAKGKEKRQP
jgi:hypothetical protein